MENQDYKKKMRQLKGRLNIEAGIRAVTIGLSAGLFGMAVLILYGRLRYQKIMLEEAGIAGLALLVAVALVCYIVWLRPRKKEVLERIDALGLEERMITMEELRQEESVLARKQRQDTKEHLAMLNVKRLRPRLYIKPLLCCLGLIIVVALLLLWPFPEKEVDEQAEQNALEIQIVDEMIAALQELVEHSEITTEHKAELEEIIEALAVNFTPEDSTLTRTAKIATASKRLDMYEAAEQDKVTLLKQQATGSEESKEEIAEARVEQRKLSQTIKGMKDIMGTSITILNNVEGTFWTPGAPSAGTSYDVEELPTEEESAEEPAEGEEPGKEEEPTEGMEPGEDGEPQEGMDGEMNGTGGELIYDPEQGLIGYGSVYEEYYQEILKALTEREFSEEIREMIEDYANSLE